MGTRFESVDHYIASHPAEVQAVLRRVRAAIRRALPDAKEVVSYQIPAYVLHGGRVIYFAGWKHHYSLYPASAELVAAFADELEAFELSKGTIRFPLSEPVPVRLIERIAKFLGRAAAERARTGPARSTRRRRSSSGG